MNPLGGNFSVPMSALVTYQKLYQRANQGFFRSRPSISEIDQLIKMMVQELENDKCSGLLCFAYEKWREYSRLLGRPIEKYEPQYFRLDCWDSRWDDRIDFCHGDMLLCIYLLYYYIAYMTEPERFLRTLQKNAGNFCENVKLYISDENPEKVFLGYLQTIDCYMQQTVRCDGPSNERDRDNSSNCEETSAGDSSGNSSEDSLKENAESSGSKEAENPESADCGEARETAEAVRLTENGDSAARSEANAEREAIFAKANAEREAILTKANAEREAILAKANAEREAILAKANAEREALLRDARAEADRHRATASEIVRTCNMRRNLRLESYEQQHSVLSENLSGVSKELQQMNQYLKNLRELNEAMRQTEGLARSMSTQKAYDQFLALYNLIADLRDYLRPENGVFASIERENAYRNYETLLEIISDDLAEYGISTACSKAGTPFNGKYHQVQTDKQFSPNTARVRESLRCGFLWGETVLRKETVTLIEEDLY